ncbi:hypothetical protein SAY86_014845 [Trapa natans]|uniref:Uncharacterized protein n=1 Tax=Trapa natans TaxID=22666 RepID=A0AAN7KP92_TRANT|nr:hypothetical protein SAY86_014845 [Trapa natans]
MAQLAYFLGRRKVLFALHIGLLLLLFCSAAARDGKGSSEIRVRRRERQLLEEEEEPIVVPKKKQLPTVAKSPPSKKQTKASTTDKHEDGGLSLKNLTKLLKPSSGPSKNITKALKPSNSTKTVKSPNGVELIKKVNSTSPVIKLKKLNSTTSAVKPKKLNATSTATVTAAAAIKLKKLNSTSSSKSSNSTKKAPPAASLTKQQQSLDLMKSASPKNKTSKSREAEGHKTPTKTHLETEPKPKLKPKQKPPSGVGQEEDSDDDLVSELRDMPLRLQQTLVPDLTRISITSKAYITAANKQMTKGIKPYVGNKYAPTIASFVSCAFILLPLLLVSLVVNRIKAYFSLQKLLVFIQIYLSIYFSILCLSSLATGLEPLRFFFTTSPSMYVFIQIMQTLAYVLYLLMLLMYLVLVFSTDCGVGTRLLGLGQAVMGYAIGLHYYLSVFHRMVQHEPPKTNWKIHGIYATCFLVICLFTQAERRKKAYREDGGEEGKKS